MSTSRRYTPPAVAKLMIDAILGDVPTTGIKTIVDAGCGKKGIWGLAAKERIPSADLFGIELEDMDSTEISALIDQGYHSVLSGMDFLQATLPEWLDPIIDLWVCNPPFEYAVEFFNQMLRMSGGHRTRIIMFASNGFIETPARRKLFQTKVPAKLVILDKRIVDKSIPGEAGQDMRGRIALYWDTWNMPKPGYTRAQWVGSDYKDDYIVRP